MFSPAKICPKLNINYIKIEKILNFQTLGNVPTTRTFEKFVAKYLGTYLV